MHVAFYDMPAQPIENDIRSLPYTWKVIARKKSEKMWYRGKLYSGTAGGWPVRKLR
jgi:hypothetical protein